MRRQEETRTGNGTARTKKRAVFLVLHYLAEPTTRKCVETLLATFPPERCGTAVVIADNASPDGSGARLAARYEKRFGVDVLLLSDNAGFAEGNNLACAFARERYDADLIIALNNDVLIRDPQFLETAERICAETGCAVLGPDIRNAETGRHESPIHELLTAEFVRRRMERFHKDNRCYFLYYYLKRPLQKLCFRLRYGADPVLPWNSQAEGMVLQGSCVLFTRAFFRLRDRLYHPDTFLYFEEDILALECARAGLKAVYSPALWADHLRDRSMKADLPSRYQLEKRKHRELEHSMRVFLEVYGGEKTGEDETGESSAAGSTGGGGS